MLWVRCPRVGSIAYTVTVDNVGNQGASDVVITETVPTGTTFSAGASSLGWVCVGGAVVTCTLDHGALAAGASVDYTFAVTVGATVPSGLDEITNLVSVTDPGDTNATNDSATEITPLDAAPVLGLTKADGATGTLPGATDVYVLRVTNTGDQEATGVVLTETVPADTTFDLAGSTAGWVGCADGAAAGTVCTFTIGSIAAAGGAVNVSFAVTVDDPVPSGVTQIVNSVSVTAEGGNNGVVTLPGPVTDTNTLTAVPDLTIAKSDGGVSVSAGGLVTYSITVTNSGDQASSGSTITETVPLNSTFDQGASTAGWVGCVDGAPGGSVCTFDLGGIAGGGASAAPVDFAVTAVSAVPAGVTELDNDVSVADDGLNGVEPSGNNDANDTTPLVAVPDVTVSIDDGVGSTTPGSLLVYTVLVDNVGSQGASGVDVEVTVPVGTSFDAGSSSAGWVCVPGGGAGSVCTLDVGTVEVADPVVSVDFAVTVDAGVASGVDTIDAVAVVADDGANGVDPNLLNNTNTDVDTLDAAPDLKITKTGPVDVTPGASVIYSLLVENVGRSGLGVVGGV